MSIELYCAEHTGSPEPPRTPGKSPTPSSPHIIHIAIVLVLSQSTWSRSSICNERSDLVVAFQLKSSRTFNSNVTPFPSASPLRTYTLGQLELFKEDHDLHPEVDSAIYHLYDKSAMAEVECYCINRKKLKRDYEELCQIQHDIWKHELMVGGCARRMAGARIYQRIEVVNRSRLRVLMDEYKACRHGRWSWKGGNVTFRLQYLRRCIGLPHSLFPFFNPFTVAHVWYNLVTSSMVFCTIQSGNPFSLFFVQYQSQSHVHYDT